MSPYVLDWVNLLLRFAHVVVAIAWIGASFYFVFLDNSLTPPEDADVKAKGVDGELWAVHGGGFYHPQKYLVAPPRIPQNLHWFYWESYSTWLTGFALFSVMYLYQADSFLIDKRVHDWTPAAAGATTLAFLAVFWLAYDSICRVWGQRRHGERIVSVLVFALVVVASWLACRWYAGRAAFVLVGAMMATAMSANVFFWIIPGQRKVIAQMRAGEPVGALHGQRAKQRSVHNTYFTLPVLVAMLSNHYGFLYGAPRNWLVLVLVMGAGALIRHFFVARHQALVQRRAPPWGTAAAGCIIIAGVVAWLAPTRQAATATPASVSFAQVQQVVSQRCVQCHNEQLANKNIQLHTPALIAAHAQQIYQQAVLQKTMPLNNVTQITDAERATLARWYEQGALSTVH